MAVYFLDSSGIVKRYVNETGTAWIRRVCDPAGGNDIYTAHVTGAEHVTDGLVQLAIDLVQRHPLRGYDAVQLASALQVKAGCAALGIPAPIFVSADAHLNAAAAAEGLAVDDPNAHP